MKRIVIYILILMSCFSYKASAHKLWFLSQLDSLNLNMNVDSLPDSYLDTLNLDKKIKINDYNMIGVNYGACLNQTYFTPTIRQSTFFTPNFYGVTYTRYAKMFKYMPYFGIQIGLYTGQEGYKFKKDRNGYIYNIDNAEKVIYQYVEMPIMTHLHIDIWRMKLMANIGMYTGYRTKISRFGTLVPKMDIHKFYAHDIRFDYGFQGGLGFGIMLDPIELHFMAMLKQSLSSLYKPDIFSKYFYSYAYPSNLILSFGIHFQLTKRIGKTRAQLKQEAYNIVFPKQEVKEEIKEKINTINTKTIKK